MRIQILILGLKGIKKINLAQASVVQKLDSTIHWLNLRPIGFPSTEFVIYPVDSAIE